MEKTSFKRQKKKHNKGIREGVRGNSLELGSLKQQKIWLNARNSFQKEVKPLRFPEIDKPLSYLLKKGKEKKGEKGVN